jgi:hypothetical protein
MIRDDPAHFVAFLYIALKFIIIIVIIKRQLLSLANLHVINECIMYDHVHTVFHHAV